MQQSGDGQHDIVQCSVFDGLVTCLLCFEKSSQGDDAELPHSSSQWGDGVTLGRDVRSGVKTI